MKILIALLPNNIIEHYQLQEKVFDGYAYMEIRKGMYGLPQAGILSANSSRNNWRVMGTLSNCTHQDYGSMQLARCGSTYV
jgi:hypothetical protein